MSAPQFILNNGMWMTFDEILNDLETRISLADKKLLAAEQKDDLIKYHHGFGTWIRNSYGLWSGNPLTEQWRTNPASHKMVRDSSGVDVDESDDHPDAVSMRLIEELHDRVQYLNKP